MKFLYEYRTSDNAKHNGVVSAADRDAAYAVLKRQGIKPSRMTEAPGVINKVFGKGKRWIAIAALSVLAAILAFALLRTKEVVQEQMATLEDTERRQPLGDSALIEKCIKDGWREVFENEGERFLASFAIPGVPSGLRTTQVAELEEALRRRIEPREDDSIEVRQIKAMVEGMKGELRAFLKDGGSISEYGKELVRRQEREVSYYQMSKNEIDEAKRRNVPESQLIELWEKRNDRLRRMGIKLVPMPE